MHPQKTTIQITVPRWQELNELRSSPGDTFDDVIRDLLPGAFEHELARYLEMTRGVGHTTLATMARAGFAMQDGLEDRGAIVVFDSERTGRNVMQCMDAGYRPLPVSVSDVAGGKLVEYERPLLVDNQVLRALALPRARL